MDGKGLTTASGDVLGITEKPYKLLQVVAIRCNHGIFAFLSLEFVKTALVYHAKQCRK
jgi:hypothetical protein